MFSVFCEQLVVWCGVWWSGRFPGIRRLRLRKLLKNPDKLSDFPPFLPCDFSVMAFWRLVRLLVSCRARGLSCWFTVAVYWVLELLFVVEFYNPLSKQI
jgi:hypothetical protein